MEEQEGQAVSAAWGELEPSEELVESATLEDWWEITPEPPSKPAITLLEPSRATAEREEPAEQEERQELQDPAPVVLPPPAEREPQVEPEEPPTSVAL